MADIQQIYKENYSDMPFDDFARRYHQKFYSDMPFDAFSQKAGFGKQAQTEAAPAPGKTQGESAVRGLAQGLTLGFQDEMAGAGSQSPLPGADAVSKTTLGALSAPDVIGGLLRRALGGGSAQAQTAERDRQRSENAQAQKDNPWSYTGGNVAGAIATAVPTAGLAAAPTLGGQVVRGAALGAGYGGVQGAGESKEMADVPYEAAKGAITGGLVGAAVPAALAGARRLVSPAPVNAARQPYVDTLRNEGVELSAGQATGSKPLLWTESTLSDLPLGGGRAFAERQGEQFTRAALRRAGIDAPRATPDVLDDALTRMGQQFDDLASRNTIRPDRQLASDLGAAIRDYDALVGPSQRAPVLNNTIQDIVQTIQQNGGSIPGEFYQAARSRLDRMARSSRNDPQLQEALFGIRNALDDAMERGLRAANSPDLGAWREVRSQYRNFIPIERAATGAGAETAQGILSPSQLKNAVASQNRRAYARGQGDLADLVRAGEAVMKPLPNSGTAQRTMYGGLLAGGAASMGPGALMYALAGPAAGRALLNPRVSRALNNQIMVGPASDTTQQLVRALMSAPAGQQLIANNR